MGTQAAGAGWVDLLLLVPDARVLLVGTGTAEEVAALERRGATVTSAATYTDAAAHLEPGPWDAVIFVGGLDRRRPVAAATVGAAAAELAPGGTLAVVASNQWSTARLVAGRHGHAAPSGLALRPTRRLVTAAGLDRLQVFALFRSRESIAAAFDIAAPRAAASVLGDVSGSARGFRRLAIRTMRTAGAYSPALWPRLSSWLLLASAGPPDRPSLADGALRPTGRVSLSGSRESRVLLGEPPVASEKRYDSVAAAEREHEALLTLAAAGCSLTPRVLTRPAPDILRLSWIDGVTLAIADLTVDELECWIMKAGRVLASIHACTRRPGSDTVLLHGDFWLGNLIVQGDRIVGVIDWTESRWGPAENDVRHLVAIAVRVVPRAVPRQASLLAAAQAAYAAAADDD